MGRQYMPAEFGLCRAMRWGTSTMPQGIILNAVTSSAPINTIYQLLVGMTLYPSYSGLAPFGAPSSVQCTWSRSFVSLESCDCFGIPIDLIGHCDYIVNWGREPFGETPEDLAAIRHSFRISFSLPFCQLQPWFYGSYESTLSPLITSTWSMNYDYFGLFLGCPTDLQFGPTGVQFRAPSWEELSEPIVYDPLNPYFAE